MEIIDQSPHLMEVLGQITPLPQPFQQRVNSQLQTENHNARTLLLRPGKTCRKLYFIKSGFFRAYHLDKSGKEYTTWFMGTGDLMISVHSFFTQTPAEEYIEVLQDAVLQSISWLQLQAYYADFRESNYLGRIVTEKYYIQSEDRALFLRTQSPEERYQHLWNCKRSKPEGPFVYFESYFHPSVGLTGDEDYKAPLYEMLENTYQVIAMVSKEEISARLADDFIAETLETIVGSTILFRKRFVYDIDEKPIDYNLGYYKADSFVYTVESRRE